MLLPFLAFVAVFLLISSAGVLLFYRQATRKRLSEVVARTSPDGPTVGPGSPSKLGKLVKPFENVVPRTAGDISTVEKRMIRSGYRNKAAVDGFFAAKVMVPGALCLLVTVTGLYSFAPFFAYALAGGLGFLIPDFWLSNRISARQMKLRLGLPEALDLIVVCVEAGLSLDKATMRTAQELRISQPVIADELNLVYLEQRAGRPRAEAWRDIGDRTDVDTIRSLASILVQADKFGTSVGKTLRAHSESLRTRRRQDAEEQAAKTTVKLVFPLVLFIFPSLFVVTLGPSMITMME